MEGEHVERVDMIISGLLEMAAVFADLLFHRLAHVSATGCLPFFRPRQSGKQSAQGVQRHGFAQ